MVSSDFQARLYPGAREFGFTAVDGTLPFLLRVHSLIGAGQTVLDYGAGRGFQATHASGIKRQLLDLRQRGVRVIGVDVSAEVRGNPLLDEALLLGVDGVIPLGDESVDVVVADWVCEHLPEPVAALAEIRRVLKQGGWFAFRTPNKWHYSMVVSRLIPDVLHTRVLRRAQETRREDGDVFAKYYRLNTVGTCRRLLRGAGFEHVIMMSHEPEPAYLHFNAITYLAGAIYQRIAAMVPWHGGRLILMGFARKPSERR